MVTTIVATFLLTSFFEDDLRFLVHSQPEEALKYWKTGWMSQKMPMTTIFLVVHIIISGTMKMPQNHY